MLAAEHAHKLLIFPKELLVNMCCCSDEASTCNKRPGSDLDSSSEPHAGLDMHSSAHTGCEVVSKRTPKKRAEVRQCQGATVVCKSENHHRQQQQYDGS